VVPHGALANYARTAVETYGLTAADRVLQFASTGFDISVEEIFGALSAGAALVLRTDAMLASPAEFARLCGAWGVSVVSLPTAFWHGVAAEADGLDLPPSLRLVVIGGERALPERVAAWQRAAGDAIALVNTYGPTECTVASTAHRLASTEDDGGREVPIGRPLPNQRAHVLDDRGDTVPVGLPGELYLGGAGVARGYGGRPALTAERFVPDPFSSTPGARLYRTGDRARRRADGTLEFLRRRDDQVKVRGFRVEPGEVEAALRAHPAVRDAAVAVRESAAGERRLVGYVVAAADVDLDEVRAHLRGRLPDYMVPFAVVRLDALPLTPGGKTDRRALRAPPEERTRAGAAPRGPLEEAVAAAWREVLALPAVGADDNFFDLGGHSVGLARVQALLRDRLERDVSVVELFRFPTVRALAAHLSAGDDAAAGDRGRERARSRRDSLLRRRERSPGPAS
jgi:acyl-coenzyme A synthetase/AMP-(fatty) acid ligase